MGKRSLLSRAEVVEVMRFVGDVAGHKADPMAQRRFLADGLVRLAGCDIGFTYTAQDWLPGREARFASAIYATHSEDVFARYAKDVLAAYGLDADPYCPGTIVLPGHAAPGAMPIVSVGRRDVLPDLAAERRHGPFVEYGARARLGDGVICFARLEGGGAPPGRMIGVGIHRADGGRQALAMRQRSRVRLAIAECAALIARGHLPLPEFAATSMPGIAGLTPRRRDVLLRLLAGESPKGIADQLGLSVWTVREHVSNLYAHFDVDSREALMARFISR